MKRAIFVSALVLALMVALCGEAFSRSTPWSYADPGTGGDDHTWGGDSQVVGDDPGGVFESASSWIPSDMFITNLFMKWLGFGEARYKSDLEPEVRVHDQDRDVEPVEPVTPSTGGLQ
jgi:hypothetical protein